ncbi:hypothetical protein NBRC116493_23220 [Aurantivibrio infirmus]
MKIRAIFLVTFLTACGGQADLEGIKQRFSENRDSFERIYSMIQEETFTSPCFAVGTDHIGDYWEHSGKWNTNQNYERKILLEQVLNEVGLSKERYENYLSLLKKISSERIEYCPKQPSWVRIMVHRSGLAVSGCLTTINLNGDGSIPNTDIKPSYSSEITPLVDGWYLNHDCT